MTPPTAQTLRVIVHDIGHVRAALTAAQEAGAAAELWSPPFGGQTHGGAYWAALEALARESFEGVDFSLVVDCGDRAGDAMAALDAGCQRLRFQGHATARQRLAEMAGRVGAILVDGPPPERDLWQPSGVDDALARCRALLRDEWRETC